MKKGQGVCCARCGIETKANTVPQGNKVVCKNCVANVARKGHDSTGVLDDFDMEALREALDAKVAGRPPKKPMGAGAKRAVERVAARVEGRSAQEAIWTVEPPAMDVPRNMRPAEAEEAAEWDWGVREGGDGRAVCRRLVETGICVYGEHCEDWHPPGSIVPDVSLPADPPAGPGMGFMFIERDPVTRPYLENLEGGHLRRYEPTPAAWAFYEVPKLKRIGFMPDPGAAGTLANRYLKESICCYVDVNRTVKVRLLRYVVDTMRKHLRYSSRSASAAEFFAATHRSMRVTSNLRITAEEEDRHKHYATLLGFFDDEHDADVARVTGAARGTGVTARLLRAAAARPLTCGAATLGLGLTGSLGLKLCSIYNKLEVAERHRREADAALRMLVIRHMSAPRSAAAGSLLGAMRDLCSALCGRAATAGDRANELRGVATEHLVRASESLSDGAAHAADASLLGLAAAREEALGAFEELKRAAVRETAAFGNDRAGRAEVGEFVSSFYHYFMGPVLEEAMKHATDEKGAANAPARRHALMGIIFIETMGTLAGCVHWAPETAMAMLMARMATNCMHVATSAMPIGPAIAVHCGWNVGVAPLMVRWANGRARDRLHRTSAMGCSAGAAFAAVCYAAWRVWRGWGSRARRERAAKRVKNADPRSLVAMHTPLAFHATPAGRARAAQLRAALSQERAPGAFVGTDAFLFTRRDRPGQPTKFYPGDDMVPRKVVVREPGVVVAESNAVMESDELWTDAGRCIAEWTKEASLEADAPSMARGFKEGDCAVRAPVAQYGFAAPEYRPLVPARRHANTEAVVDFRIAQPVPTADIDVAEDCMAWFMEHFHDLFHYPNGARVGRILPVPREDFLRRVGSSPPVKRLLRETFAELDRLGISANSRLNARVIRGLCKHKIFIKREGLSLRSEAGSTKKAARPIVPFNPALLCLVGPWLMAAQGVYEKCWNKDFFLTLAGGKVSNEDVGRTLQKLHDAGWALFYDDAGKWDMTCTNKEGDQQKYIVALYKRHGAPQLVVALLLQDTQGSYSMVAFHITKPNGQTNSGGQDTWFKNGLRNGLTHAYISCRTWQCSVAVAGQLTKMFLSGDDNVGAHAGSLRAPRWSEKMAALGHEADPKYSECPDENGFCSKVTMDSSDGPKLTPLAGRFITRSGLIVDPPRDVEPSALMRGIALGSYKDWSHHPIVRPVLDRYLELTDGHKEHYPRSTEFKTRARLASTATAKTWEQVEHRYPGWTMEVQRRFERRLAEMQLGDNYDFPEVAILAERDLDGPFVGDKHTGESSMPWPSMDWGPPLAVTRARAWIRDLTREGVEPNPGPVGAAGALALGAAVAAGAVVVAARAIASMSDTEWVQQYVRLPDGELFSCNVQLANGKLSLSQVRAAILAETGLDESHYHLMQCGRTFHDDSRQYTPGAEIHVLLRLLGGTKKKRRGVTIASQKKRSSSKPRKPARAHTPTRRRSTKKKSGRGGRARPSGRGGGRGPAAIIAKESREDYIAAKAWAAALSDPFAHVAPAVGSGNGSTVQVFTQKIDFTLAGGCMCAVLLPRSTDNIPYCQTGNVSSLLSFITSGTTAMQYLSDSFSAGRVVAMGINWKILMNETQTPGYFGGGLLSAPASMEAAFSSSTATYNAVLNYNTTTSWGGREATSGEISWRPLDSKSGQFGPWTVNSAAVYEATNIPYIIASGWPAGQIVRVTFVTQLEMTPKQTASNNTFGAAREHDWGNVVDMTQEIMGQRFRRPARLTPKTPVVQATAGTISNPGWFGWAKTYAAQAAMDAALDLGRDFLVGASGGAASTPQPVPPSVWASWMSSDGLVASIDPPALKAQIEELKAKLAAMDGAARPGPAAASTVHAATPTSLEWVEHNVGDPPRVGGPTSAGSSGSSVSGALSHPSAALVAALGDMTDEQLRGLLSRRAAARPKRSASAGPRSRTATLTFGVESVPTSEDERETASRAKGPGAV